MRTEELNSSNLRHLMDYYARKFTLAEKRLREVLPAWITSAHSVQLKWVLRSYQSMVQMQVKNMEAFLMEEHLKSGDTRVNLQIQEFVKETDARLLHAHDSREKDAWLLASAKAVNEFKINMYDMAACFARSLGMVPAAKTFEAAVKNERHITECLNNLVSKEIDLSLVEPVHIMG